MAKIPRSSMITFDRASLERYDSGSIIGVIFFNFGDSPFPGQGWSDFVVVILCWWLEGLRHLRFMNSVTFRFMDGPYQARATLGADGQLRVRCVEMRRADIVRCDTSVGLKDFEKAIVLTGKDVLAACQERGWQS